MSEQLLKEHVSHLLSESSKRAGEDGGPFSDNSGGLVIVEVSGIDEAKRIVDQDPAIINGVLITTVHKWKRIV